MFVCVSHTYSHFLCIHEGVYFNYQTVLTPCFLASICKSQYYMWILLSITVNPAYMLTLMKVTINFNLHKSIRELITGTHNIYCCHNNPNTFVRQWHGLYLYRLSCLRNPNTIAGRDRHQYHRIPCHTQVIYTIISAIQEILLNKKEHTYLNAINIDELTTRSN